MVSFDPYLNWLGIPAHEQPPNYYRLLGVVLFESNPEVIEQAADRQSLRVGAYQAGPQGEACQQLLSEIAMAQFCLLDPQQKAAYDGQLQESLAQRGEAPSGAAGVGREGVRRRRNSVPSRRNMVTIHQVWHEHALNASGPPAMAMPPHGVRPAAR